MRHCVGRYRNQIGPQRFGELEPELQLIQPVAVLMFIQYAVIEHERLQADDLKVTFITDLADHAGCFELVVWIGTAR